MALISLFGAYTLVFIAGSMYGSISSTGRATIEAESSSEVKAIDADIEAIKTKIEGLAIYSDSQKAQNEMIEAKKYEADISEQKEILSSCTIRFKNPEHCINKAQNKINDKRERLESLVYYKGNSDYQTNQKYLSDLQKQRVELLNGGANTSTGSGADDKLVAWVFGVKKDEAMGIKWLFFVLCFDVLSLFFRLTGELSEPDFKPA